MSLVHLFGEYMLSAYCAPTAVLGTGNGAVNTAAIGPCLPTACLPEQPAFPEDHNPAHLTGRWMLCPLAPLSTGRHGQSACRRTTAVPVQE